MFKSSRKCGLRKCLTFLLIQLLLVGQLPLYAAVPAKVLYNEKYGRTRESFDGKSGKMIIHIQDAHCIYEAQKNIIGIVRDLYDNHNVRLITVEGADAYFNADELSSFPVQSVREDVADYFMLNGRISGAEYLLIQNDLPLALRGAENKDLYIENYNSFLSAMPQPGDQVMTSIDMLDDAVASLKALMLTDDLREIDSLQRMHANGELQFVDYADYLIEQANSLSISFADMPNIQILLESQSLEDAIDFAAIHIEVGQLIDAMADSIDREQLTQLLNKNLFYKIGKISPSVFFNFLQDTCEKNDISIAQYANLNTYCEYLGLYNSIDDVAIADEVNSLETQIKDVLLVNPLQKELIDVSQDLVLLRKLMSLKLSKQELKRFQENTDKFSEERFLSFLRKTVPTYDIPFNFDYDYSAIGNKLPMIDNFYKVAAKRNEALIENTIAEMDLEDSNIAVLITGGFHTLGITDILKDEDISYRVISPAITEQPETSNYLARLVGMPTEMENILTANNLQIPLVLADPAIIPDVAAPGEFITAFKSLLETHPGAVNLEQLLAENPTGYAPQVTFTDAFMVGDVRYTSFEVAGQKLFLAVASKDAQEVDGVKPTVIGEYAFAFIPEGTFVAQAQDPARRMIEKQTNMHGIIDAALLTGQKPDLTAFAKPENADFQVLQSTGQLVQQADGSYLPSLGFMLRSTLSALVVKPRIAQVDALDAATKDVLTKAGVSRVEVFSNQTDLSAQDIELLQNGLPNLIANKKIELTNGKVVRAVFDEQTGLMQVYSMAPQGALQVKPQLIINEQIFNSMLPQSDRVSVTSALQSERRGYISIDATNRVVTLFEIDENGERTSVGDPAQLGVNITSADILSAVIEMRKRALDGGIGLIGYGNPDAGYAISFENLDELLDSVEDSSEVKAFTNVHRLLTVVPAFQDIDLSDKQDFPALMDYLYSLLPDPKTADDKITCAAAAAALLHNMVQLDGVPMRLLNTQRKQLMARMLPLIDLRMKGAYSVNTETKEPEYSMYSIQQAYTIFGQTSQALNTNIQGLETLLKNLPVGESVVLHLHIGERKHFVAVRSTDQGFEVQDIARTQDKVIKPRREFVMMGLDQIIDRYGKSFTGNILVSETVSGITDAMLGGYVADGTMRVLDIDEQLAAVGATSNSMELQSMFLKENATPLAVAQDVAESMKTAQPVAARAGYAMHMLFRRPTHKYFMQQPDDEEPIETINMALSFDVTFNADLNQIEVLVRQNIDGQTSYLTVSPTGELTTTPLPTKEQLDAMNLTLQQWEQQVATKFTPKQIAEIFGEDMAEEIGVYGGKIEGLTTDTVNDHLIDIFNVITAKMLTDMVAPELILTRVTGYVKNASDYQPEVARRVEMYNRYSDESLNRLRQALRVLNLEQPDMMRLVRQGPFELDPQGRISAVPERMLVLLAAIQKTDMQSLAQEGIYHELVEYALANYRGGDLIGEVASRLSATSKDTVSSLFQQDYSGSQEFQTINDIVREVIAKVYTNRMLPDSTSAFFANPKSAMVINDVDTILNQIAPEFFNVVNPTTDSPQQNIDRIISQINTELGLPIDPAIQNAVTNDEEIRYINSMLSAETMAAIKYLNDRIAQVGLVTALEEAKTLSERIKSDLDLALIRSQQELDAIPNITAISADFFDTKDDINDSRTIGVTQKIQEAAGDDSKLFVVYSLTDNANTILAKLAAKGITAQMVTIVDATAFQKAIQEDPSATYVAGAASNILRLPQIIQQVHSIESVDLQMMDFAILDNNPDVVQVALDNLASVFEVPNGFDDSQIVDGQQIETGISALELVETLENMGDPDASLPKDLLVTDVSKNNAFIYKAFVELKEQTGTDEVSIEQLLGHIGLSSFSKEDLRGVRVKRKVTVNKGFIEKLQAQRALDISA